ncbi:MAG: hypothetical protein HKN23_01620 [Verrucomicrobiales bacterium]|nr:hypothetical protein [Verrucomicrobiales bacterium]
MKKQLLTLAAVAGMLTSQVVQAGDPVVDKMPVEEPLGATISTGYMTNYIFYGVDFGEDGIWTGIDYTLNMLPIPVDVGVWYINPVSGPGNDDELDLYASVAGPSFAGFDTSLAFTAFLFPESGGGETYEVSLGVGRSLGIVDLAASAHYDFEIEGWYFDAGVEKALGLTDNVDLVVSAGISYQNDYYSAGGDWNHVWVQASFPIALRSNVTLEPYVAGLFALDAIEDIQDDIVHGGVSLSVSF